MTNRTQIPLTPLGDRLAVILDPKLTQSVGGIVIPGRAQEVPSWGTVISHGPDAQHCIPGDRVYVPTHLGTSYIAGVGAEAVSLVIIHEAKVLAREERTYKLATGQDRAEEEISSDTTQEAPTNIVGFARPLPDQVNPLDATDDDLGELDASRACKVGNPGCESCE